MHTPTRWGQTCALCSISRWSGGSRRKEWAWGITAVLPLATGSTARKNTICTSISGSKGAVALGQAVKKFSVISYFRLKLLFLYL